LEHTGRRIDILEDWRARYGLLPELHDHHDVVDKYVNTLDPVVDFRGQLVVAESLGRACAVENSRRNPFAGP
jgi:hypothetical protein